MRLLGIRSIVQWGTALRRAFGGDILRHPIGRAPDEAIDRALAERGQTRADLFSPTGARARHRVRMARMMAAHRVDVRHAVARFWPLLKTADNYCRHCPEPARCRRWLERRSHGDAPKAFCPNARLFADIAEEQDKR